MLNLCRSVRFCVNFSDEADARARANRHNTFAAWPCMVGIGAFYEVEATLAGEVDPRAGIMMNTADIDRELRTHVIGHLSDALRSGRSGNPALVLREAMDAVHEPLDGRIAHLRWRLTPYYSITIMNENNDQFLIRQQFEFAASHRLCAESISDEENVQRFGKCNRPNGHGHNYRIEVAVLSPFEPAAERGFDVLDLERIVHHQVIERFDHRHLNLDCEEFANVNPSVEHIARVCHDLLDESIANAGGDLAFVTVWETDKTASTYPAQVLVGGGT